MVGLRNEWPSIWLVGFSARGSNVEEVIETIVREAPDAELFLEVPEAQKDAFEARVAKLRDHLHGLSLHCMPSTGEEIIAKFTVNHLKTCALWR